MAQLHTSLMLILALASASAKTDGGTISLTVPEGWRELTQAEIAALKGEIKPQNELQRRVHDEPEPKPLIVIKHDTGSGMAAAVQVFAVRLPQPLNNLSPLGIATLTSRTALKAFPGKLDITPREIKVAGLPGAEWAARYTLVEQYGVHEMRTHQVCLRNRGLVFTVGYSAPAAAEADYSAFKDVVRSFRFESDHGRSE